MSNLRFSSGVALLSLCLAISPPTGAQTPNRHKASETTALTPESLGFSSERLENLHRLIQGEIDQKQLAGAITILAGHGKILDYRVYAAGWVALECGGKPKASYSPSFFTSSL